MVSHLVFWHSSARSLPEESLVVLCLDLTLETSAPIAAEDFRMEISHTTAAPIAAENFRMEFFRATADPIAAELFHMEMFRKILQPIQVHFSRITFSPNKCHN